MGPRSFFADFFVIELLLPGGRQIGFLPLRVELHQPLHGLGEKFHSIGR